MRLIVHSPRSLDTLYSNKTMRGSQGNGLQLNQLSLFFFFQQRKLDLFYKTKGNAIKLTIKFCQITKPGCPS